MSKYSKILFIGAKGQFNGMPFEILGHGQVDYRISKVGKSDDSDDIGQTFRTTEYYCLANNGQFWYFSVADSEVYYCRQLDPKIDLRQILKSHNFENLGPSNLQSYFNFRLNGFKLIEGGTGYLKEAGGRAKPDFRNYQSFEYSDFSYNNKYYSVDFFPNKEIEWFETVLVPENQLIDIFKESLRLNNPEVQALLSVSKLWKNIFIFGIVLTLCLFITPFILAFNKTELSSESREVEIQTKEDIKFNPIKINTPNQLYTIETSTNLADGKGINLNLAFLDSNDQVVSNSNQEFYNYISTDSEDEDTRNSQTSFYTEFYPKNSSTFTPLLKINDYGDVGQTLNNDIPSGQKLQFRIVLYQGGVIWFPWFAAAVFSLILSCIAFYNSKSSKQKTWA